MSSSNKRLVAVSVERFSSNDGYGGTTYEDAIEINCHVQTVEELIKDQHGDEVRSSTVLYFYDPDVINYDDRVTPPGGKTRQVVKLRESPSIRGRKILKKVWLR